MFNVGDTSCHRQLHGASCTTFDKKHSDNTLPRANTLNRSALQAAAP